LKLLLDVYTSLIFRLSFALPVSFVYRNYSVRVKRKFFGEVRVGVRAARARCETGGTGGSASRTGKDVGLVGQVGRVGQVSGKEVVKKIERGKKVIIMDSAIIYQKIESLSDRESPFCFLNG